MERLARTLAASTTELFPATVRVAHFQSSGGRPRCASPSPWCLRAAAKEDLAWLTSAPAVLAQERDSLHVKLVAPRPYRFRAAATGSQWMFSRRPQ